MTLELAKRYLRVDTSDDDELISKMLESSEKMCLDILRSKPGDTLPETPELQMGMLYALAYMYERREDANHKEMMFTLRHMLGADRREVF